MGLDSGVYLISSTLPPQPVIGVDPRIRSATKPLIVLPNDFPKVPFEVVNVGDNRYIIVIDHMDVKPLNGKVFAFLSDPNNFEWELDYNEEFGGYIVKGEGGNAWCLQNSNPFTEVEYSILYPDVMPTANWVFKFTPVHQD